MNLKKHFYRLKGRFSPAGTKDWLIATEMKYGGMITNVPRNKVSAFDPRSPELIKQGGMTGGDRMRHLGYADDYARYLSPFINSNQKITLAEIGILKGTGLAIWCDLFRQATIYGFDIDTSHFYRHRQRLKQMGAFKYNRPHIYKFDQFVDNTKYLGQIFKAKRLNICIDDGFHAEGPILLTLKSIMPYLADSFVYFIEDNDKVHLKVRKLYPDFKVYNKGLLTIVTR